MQRQVQQLEQWALVARSGQKTMTLTVLHAQEEKTPEQELVDDLLTILACFAGRLDGLCSRQQKAFVDCAKQVLAA